MISIQDMAACCLNNACITGELALQLKQLTMTYSQSFNSEKVTLYNECWKLIGKSVNFWENVGILLDQQLGYEVKLHALVLICERVKTNWIYQNQTIKLQITNYLCTQAKVNNADLTNQQRSICKKINDIIAQILKYQWKNSLSSYLCVVCNEMLDSNLFAQNYFDLLHTIFNEIFSDQVNLIAEEAEALKAEVLKSYNLFQKCFEKYLKVQTSEKTLKNCIRALSELVDWIPSYYIFIGSVISQLHELVQHSDCKQESILCLLTILDLPNNELTQTLLTKIYTQKRRILLQLLANRVVIQKQSIIPKLMHSSLKFLEEQKKDIEKYGQKAILIDSDETNTNNSILQNLIKVMEQCERSLHIPKGDMIILYKLIVMLGKEDVVELQKIIKNVISVTPSPFAHPYLRGEPVEDEEIEQNRKDFVEIMKNLLSHQYEDYFTYIFKELDSDFITHGSYVLLQKIVNNIYYCLEACSHIQLKQKIFIVISKLLAIDKKISNAHPSTHLPNLARVVKLGMHLILGHSRCRNTIFQSDVYCRYLNKAFVEDIQFVLTLLSIISNYYNNFTIDIKNHLHQHYVKDMIAQKHRLQADLIYLQIIGKWVLSNYKQNHENGLEYTLDILDAYKKFITQLKTKKINTIRRSEIVQYQHKLFNKTLQYLKLIHTSLPYLKSQLVYHIYPELPIIEQIKSIINLADEKAESILFFKLALKILMWNFSMLTKEQVNKNIDLILGQSKIVVDHILRDLHADKICTENIGSMLDYLSQFIISLGEWGIQNAQKVAMTTKIVEVVFGRSYLFEIPGYSNFIHSIIKCNTLPFLQPQIHSTTISTLYQMSTCENENITLECLKIMETIYTECISNPVKQKLLFNYILDCINYNYIILVNLLYVQHFIQEYSDVLFLGLAFVKNSKQKFTLNGVEVVSNIHTVLNMLIETTRKIDASFEEDFMEKVSKFLSSIVIDINNKNVFCDRIKDLVVILRRGK